MKMTVYSLEQAARWDEIVTSFSDYDVYYLSGYVKAFRLHGDGEPLLFYCEDDGVRGINVVMKRDIADDLHFAGELPKDTYFDFATPYGYGGWLLEGDGDPAPLYKAYEDWCAEHCIVSEFVRFSLYSNSRDSYYGTLVPRTNNIVRALDCPMEELLMDFEHKVRKNIKKAESFGLEFCVDAEAARRKDFLDIYYGTMDRDSATDAFYFPEAFFQQIETMKGHYAYFHVLLGEKAIASELALIGTDTMYSYLGGTDSNYFSYRPNDFLKYGMIQWGLEKGCKRFVLGGGYGADDGIYRYKKSFAPNGIVQFYTGQAVFCKDTYDELVAKRGNASDNSAYFPKYRA